MSPSNADLTSQLILKNQPDAEEEPKTIWFNGELVESSRFGTMQFQEVLQLIGFSRNEIIITFIAYQDLKQYCNYKEESKRKTGEPEYHHPKGVALIDILEFNSHDRDKTLAAILHDCPEDSHTMLGNENHPSRIIQTHEIITTEDILAMRYQSRRAAKIILAVCKPKKKNEMNPETFKFMAFRRVLGLFPEVRVPAAQIKVCDRLQNLRSLPKDRPEWSAGKILESHKFIRPIARVAGEEYREALKTQLADLNDLMTPQQKTQANPVDYGIAS